MRKTLTWTSPVIAQRLRRTLNGSEKNPYYGRVRTVEDLVRFMEAAPLEQCREMPNIPQTRTRSSPPHTAAHLLIGKRPRPACSYLHVMRLAGGRNGTRHPGMGHDPLEEELSP